MDSARRSWHYVICEVGDPRREWWHDESSDHTILADLERNRMVSLDDVIVALDVRGFTRADARARARVILQHSNIYEPLHQHH